jgi:hypothetical protein
MAGAVGFHVTGCDGEVAGFFGLSFEESGFSGDLFVFGVLEGEHVLFN